MELRIDSSENYIFYLQLTDELTEDFFYFSAVMSKFNFNLIPIMPEDLREVSKNINVHIMVIVSTIASFNKYQGVKKKFLSFAVKNRIVKLFELTSFIPDEELLRNKAIDSYKVYRLPLQAKKISMIIVKEYLTSMSSIGQWPGGRRAKLPTNS